MDQLCRTEALNVSASVRRLPPDPNDHSNYIEPEPD
jgi:hypothetical protein